MSGADLIWSGIHAEDEQLDGDQGLDDQDDCKQDDGTGCVAQACKAIGCQGSTEGVQDDKGGACMQAQGFLCVTSLGQALHSSVKCSLLHM